MIMYIWTQRICKHKIEQQDSETNINECNINAFNNKLNNDNIVTRIWCWYLV